MKKFFGEFKKFITRGNVMDMAVGVIVGGAFTAIVNALSNNILRPLINALLAVIMGGNNALEKVYTILVPAKDATGALDLANSIYIDWGAFISAIINFILIALVLFCIVKAMNAANEGMAKGKARFNPLTKEEVFAYRREGKRTKEIIALAQAKQAALDEEKRIADEEAAKNAPKTEAQLLAEIVDLLRDKKN